MVEVPPGEVIRIFEGAELSLDGHTGPIVFSKSRKTAGQSKSRRARIQHTCLWETLWAVRRPTSRRGT
jgi:hypothetical protein